MNAEAKIVITWEPPYEVKVEFIENPILCAFMLNQARKIIDRQFDKPVGVIQTANVIPDRLN